MEYYVGLDVSLRSCALCIVDNKGKVYLEREYPAKSRTSPIVLQLLSTR
jgi:tRNA A37 threonylcarbamoyladenosine modification protein TsaB